MTQQFQYLLPVPTSNAQIETQNTSTLPGLQPYINHARIMFHINYNMRTADVISCHNTWHFTKRDEAREQMTNTTPHIAQSHLFLSSLVFWSSILKVKLILNQTRRPGAMTHVHYNIVAAAAAWKHDMS